MKVKGFKYVSCFKKFFKSSKFLGVNNASAEPPTRQLLYLFNDSFFKINSLVMNLQYLKYL